MILFRYIFIFILLMSYCPMLHSQGVADSETDAVFKDGIIRWVAQYPADKKEKRTGFFRKLEEIVFGQRQQLIVKPVCAISDKQEKLWILSQANGKIVSIGEDKTPVLPGQLKKDIVFPSLVSACLLPGKGLLFTDSSLDKVYFMSENKDEISDFCKQHSLNQPTGIACSPATDEIWIAETASHIISVFNSDGEFIKSIGKRGSEDGEFNFPTHICIDKNGSAYIVDAMNFRIQIFNSSGEWISSFGEAGDASGSLARPKGIAVDSYGNIYVVDALFNNIQIFSGSGELLYYFGSQGNEKGEFWMPAGIFIDENNYIYVSDSFNNRVQVFQLIKGDL